MSVSFSDARVVGTVVSSVVSGERLKATVRVARRDGTEADVIVSAPASCVPTPGDLVRVMGELGAGGNVEVGTFGEIVILMPPAEAAPLPRAEIALEEVAGDVRAAARQVPGSARPIEPPAAGSRSPTVPSVGNGQARTSPFASGFGRKPTMGVPQSPRPPSVLQPPAGLQTALPEARPSSLRPPGMPAPAAGRVPAPSRPAFGAPRPATKLVAAAQAAPVTALPARRSGTLGAPSATADDAPEHEEADDARHQSADASRARESHLTHSVAPSHAQQGPRVPPTRPDEADILIPW
jgi:hypothetical protein